MKITRKQLRKIILEGTSDLSSEESEALLAFNSNPPDGPDAPLDPLLVSALSKMGILSPEAAEVAASGEDIVMQDLGTWDAGMSFGDIKTGLAQSIEDMEGHIEDIDTRQDGETTVQDPQNKKTVYTGPEIKGMHRYFLSGVLASTYSEGDPNFDKSQFQITDTKDGEKINIHGRELPISLDANHRGDKAIEIYDIIFPEGGKGQVKLRASYKGKDFDLKTKIGGINEGKVKITRKQLRRILLEGTISHAQQTVRKDGMSYEDFVGVIVDKLDLYDFWVLNYSIDDAVAELTAASSMGVIDQYNPSEDPYGAIAAKKRGK